MGQRLDDCGSCRTVITVQEIEQGTGGGEPDRGHSRVMTVVFEDLAGSRTRSPIQVVVTSSRSASTFMEQTCRW
jgi:hypothetical protein